MLHFYEKSSLYKLKPKYCMDGTLNGVNELSNWTHIRLRETTYKSINIQIIICTLIKEQNIRPI